MVEETLTRPNQPVVAIHASTRAGSPATAGFGSLIWILLGIGFLTLAEMERLSLIADAEDRRRVQSDVVLLTLNTCGLVSMIWHACLKRKTIAKAAFQS
jgi:hypothetical protein